MLEYLTSNRYVANGWNVRRETLGSLHEDRVHIPTFWWDDFWFLVPDCSSFPSQFYSGWLTDMARLMCRSGENALDSAKRIILTGYLIFSSLFRRYDWMLRRLSQSCSLMFHESWSDFGNFSWFEKLNVNLIHCGAILIVYMVWWIIGQICGNEPNLTLLVLTLSLCELRTMLKNVRTLSESVVSRGWPEEYGIQ
jgi:hypothetical protein